MRGFCVRDHRARATSSATERNGRPSLPAGRTSSRGELVARSAAARAALERNRSATTVDWARSTRSMRHGTLCGADTVLAANLESQQIGQAGCGHALCCIAPQHLCNVQNMCNMFTCVHVRHAQMTECRRDIHTPPLTQTSWTWSQCPKLPAYLPARLKGLTFLNLQRKVHCNSCS